MSDGTPPADNPFVDPQLDGDQQGSLEADSTLFVTHDASLTLGADALIVLDDSFIHRDVSNCCGLLPSSVSMEPVVLLRRRTN